jgi:superfamily I DNA/RNA helicase
MNTYDIYKLVSGLIKEKNEKLIAKMIFQEQKDGEILSDAFLEELYQAYLRSERVNPYDFMDQISYYCEIHNIQKVGEIDVSSLFK